MRPSLLLALATLLAACTTTPPSPPPSQAPEQSWLSHQRQLERLEEWQLSGRLAVINGHEAWHMNLRWQQQLARFDIEIIAPLGQGTMRLIGDDTEVMLMDEEGRYLNASSPETLLYEQLGWRLPVSALRYWVLGLPAPGESRHELDDYGRLSQLSQSGWVITFSDYRPREGAPLALPRKVFISNDQGQVKLVVDSWAPLPALPQEDAG